MNFFLSVPAAVWLIISALFFAGGEYFSKLWGRHPTVETTLWIFIFYTLCSLSWLPALLHKNQLAVMGTLWLLLGMVATIIVGVFVFHEKVATVQIVGIFLAFIALILLNISANN